MLKINPLLGRFRVKNQLQAMWARLYRVAYAWCHDADLASDLAQETVVKAFKNYSKLLDARVFDAWVFKILVNCWRDHLRKLKVTEPLDEDTLIQYTHPEHEHSQWEIINRVRNAIAQLSGDHRQIVTLVDLEGFTYSEVAEILDIPVGTVMSRLCRARHQLKQLLSDLESTRPEDKPKLWRIK